MRKQSMLFVGMLFLSFILLIGIGHAAKINSVDCSQLQVQQAINSANDGDIVTVPAGSCTWSNYVSIADKNITLQGAGHGCSGAFSASGHPPSSCTGTATNITVSGVVGILAKTSNKSFRITGFRFNRSATDQGTIYIDKTSGQLNTKSAVPWRVDHCYFNGDARHIYINGVRNFGLTDNNIFYVPGGRQIFLFWGRGQGEQDGTSNLSILSGQIAHTDPVSLGTADALYVEDSEFFTNVWHGSQNIGDGTAGQRMVIRHNIIRGLMIENHGACTGSARGSYTYEIYNNDMYTQDWNGTSGYQFTGIKMRGGTGVIYNNNFYGTFEQHIVFDNQRSVNGAECAAPLNVTCDGNSALDMNAISGRATPLCLDQIGAGAGYIGSQEEYPVYIWGNKKMPSDNSVSPVVSATLNNPTHIVVDRDFYNSTKSGYTPYTYPHPLQRPTPPLDLKVLN